MSSATLATPTIRFTHKTPAHTPRLATEIAAIALQSLAIATTLWLLLAAPGMLNEATTTATARTHIAHR